MSKDVHDPTTATSPTPSNCIDGLGTNIRQRTGSEEEEQQQASANDGNGNEQQHSKGPRVRTSHTRA